MSVAHQRKTDVCEHEWPQRINVMPGHHCVMLSDQSLVDVKGQKSQVRDCLKHYIEVNPIYPHHRESVQVALQSAARRGIRASDATTLAQGVVAEKTSLEPITT